MNTTFSRRRLLGQMAGLAGASVTTSLVGCQTIPGAFNSTKPASDASAAIRFGDTGRVGLALCQATAQHSLFGHPENAERANSIYRGIASAQRDQKIAAFRRVVDSQAHIEQVLRVHSKRYVESVSQSLAAGRYLTKNRWSPYGSPAILEAALTAAGAATELIRGIHEGKFKTGFAITRPPGHHSLPEASGGYCIFNNIAIAVRDLQSNVPPAAAVPRVAIVDIDVHHGNGLQDIFYSDPNVLYISTHQNDWPFTGAIDKTGAGAGRGTNINIPLPYDTGDEGLRSVYEHVVVPALRRFKPELIAVATGFDTHWRDYQGSFITSNRGIAKICEILSQTAEEVCSGKIGFVLEGGYQLKVLEAAAANLVGMLSGSSASLVDEFGGPDRSEAEVNGVIKKVLDLHRLGT